MKTGTTGEVYEELYSDCCRRGPRGYDVRA